MDYVFFNVIGKQWFMVFESQRRPKGTSEESVIHYPLIILISNQ